MDIDTFTEKTGNTAVLVNGLLMPANSLTNHLRRYCEPALFHSHGYGEYNLSKAGSAFKAKYDERYFLFCTGHQLRRGQYDHSQLCILTDDDRKIVSSHAAFFADRTQNQRDDFDCNVYEFTDVVAAGALSQNGWYDMSREMANQKVEKPAIVCSIGFPSYRNEIDYELFNYGVSPNAVWGEETEASIEGRLAFLPTRPIDFCPDGMSGSPVFGCELSDLEPKAFFAGILTEASKHKFHFISRSRVLTLMDHSLR